MANSLSLQVILQAVNRATAPLRSISRQSGETAAALRASRDELRNLERAQRDMNAFRDLKRRAQQTDAALRTEQQRIQDLSRQIRQGTGDISELTRERERAIRRVRQLSQSHQNEQRALQELRTRLANVQGLTGSLAERQRQLAQRTAEANRRMQEQQERLRRLAEQQRRLDRARSNYERSQSRAASMAGAGAAGIAAGTAMALPLATLVRNYSSFEDAMLGVAKQVQGARDAAGHLTAVYYEMAAGIKEMSTHIPMATTELAALVEAGARMGIQGKKNLLTFAETTATTATAFELPVELIGEQMGKLAGLYKIPIQNISALGDAINYLDDNAQSQGGDIIDVMQRVAGIAASVNMSYRDTAALGSTFLSTGSSPEVAATAANAVIRELAIAKMQPKRFQEGLKALGLDAAQIQANMPKDATGTILKVLEAIKTLPQTRQLEVTTQLFGKEYGDDVSKLANNLGEYRRQLELANDEAARGSMQREAEARLDTLSAQWQIFKNRLFNQSSTLGKLLRSTLMGLMKTVGELVSGFGAWVKQNPELATTLLKVAAVTSVVVAGLGALGIALSAIILPFAALRYGMALFALQGGGLLAGLRTLGSGLLSFAGRAIPAVIAGVRGLTLALIANPIGLLIGVIAGAVGLIIANWDTLGPYFAKLWSWIKRLFASGWEFIKTLFSWSPLGLIIEHWGAITAWFSGLGEKIMGTLGKAIGWITDKFLAPVRAIKETLGGAWDALFGGDDEASAKVARAAQTAKKAAAAAALGASVAAGPALADVPIDTRAPIGAGGAQGGFSIGTVQITVNAAPGMDEVALARLVAAEIERIGREQAARRRSSLYDRE